MSLFYNRDRNITGISTLTGLTISPEYGSSVSFESKNAFLPYFDKYSNIAPQGLNSIVGNFSFNFNLRKNDAQKLVDFYESQSGTGIFPINDSSSIYRTLSGTIVSLGELNSQNNQKYSVKLDFAVERNSPVLNWSGQSFVNHFFSEWSDGANFVENDIVWLEHDLEEPSNNWFYCLSGHSSSLSNHPLSTGGLWTKNLFENSNNDFSFSQQPTVKKNDFRGSYAQRINDQKNIHSFDELSISYKNLSNKKTKAILHFLETKLGYKKFEYFIPEIYNRPKLFFCPSWSHQWNAKDSNNLSLRLIEDPLGAKQSGDAAITLVQKSGQSFFRFSATGNGYCFYDAGSGKNLVTGTHVLNWPSTGINHSVRFYGKIAGLTGSGQGLISARFDAGKHLKFLNLSGNQIPNTNFYYSPVLENVILANNGIVGFDLANQTGLKYFDGNNNSGTYLNVDNCSSLTGIRVKNNHISGSYIDSSLSGLYQNGLNYGLADFSQNNSISDSSIPYVTGLTGRFWTVDYDYTAPTTTTTTTPAPVPYTGINITYATNGYDACHGGTSVAVKINSTDISTATRVNFSGSSVVENGPNSFYLSDGVYYYGYNKICCGIAAYSSVSDTCIVVTSTTTTTTEPPETTTEEPSTTTTSSTTTTIPPILGCTDPSATNYNPDATLDDGSCQYP